METFWPKIIPSLFVAIGGALGAVCRFWIREFMPRITDIQFPLSTLTVNLVGCFLAGLIFIWVEQGTASWTSNRVLFLLVGFLGAFTTFSAFAIDSLLLFNHGENLKFMVNILANCILCLVCVFVGAWVGGRIAAH